ILRLRLGPDHLHRLHALSHDGEARLEVRPVIGHFLRVPAGADAEEEAPARDLVEARPPPCGPGGVALGGAGGGPRAMTRQMPVPTLSRVVAAAAAASVTKGSMTS